MVLVVFGVGFQVFDVDVGQTRHEQLDLLLVEDRDHSLGNNVVKSVQKRTQLLLDCAYTNQNKRSQKMVIIARL